MDKSLYSGVILLDAQKAFDTYNHNILVLKLRAFGANNFAIKWFSSYISECEQLLMFR